jgi:hypothetical protein
MTTNACTMLTTGLQITLQFNFCFIRGWNGVGFGAG